jgi:hypothetical protein
MRRMVAAGAPKGSIEASARCAEGGLTATIMFMYDLLIHDQLFRPVVGREALAERRARASVERDRRVRAGRRFGALRPRPA